MADQEANPPRGERVTWVDWVIVALAVVSLLLLIFEQSFSGYFRTHPQHRQWLIWTDLGICGVFFLEFLWRMVGQDSKWQYTKSRWYDLLGMIPVSHPAFRGFRLLRVLRIVVVTSRFIRATNRTFGEMAFEATARRFQKTLVDVVGDAVLLRSLDMVKPWLTRARIPERIGDAMCDRRDEIAGMVRENMQQVPGASMLLKVGKFRELIAAVESAAVDSIITTLRSEDMNVIVQQATGEVLDEWTAQLRDGRKKAA